MREEDRSRNVQTANRTKESWRKRQGIHRLQKESDVNLFMLCLREPLSHLHLS